MTENKEYEFCLRCGRKLKNPKTRLIGLGPTCHKKVLQENVQSRKLFTAQSTTDSKLVTEVEK